MYDNIYTDYTNAKIYINEINASKVLGLLKKQEQNGKLSAEHYAYLSKAYTFLQDDLLAQKYARLSIKIDKTYPYGYLRLAFSYARLGKKRQALLFTKIADKLISINNVFLLTFLAILYNYCDEKVRSKEIITKLEKLRLTNVDYYFHMGFLYSQLDPQKALEYLHNAEKVCSRNLYNIWLNIVEIGIEVEDYFLAEKYADKCLLVAETKKMLNYKSICLIKHNKYNAANKLIKKQYKLTCENADKTNLLSSIIYNYHVCGFDKKALKLINFVLKHFPLTNSFYSVVGLFYEETENYKKAIEMYKASLETDPNDSYIYSSISYCYSNLGDNENALLYADKSLQINPENAYSYYRKGRIYTSMKKYLSAIENYQKSIEYDSTDVDSFQWISYCYSMINEFEKSLEFANRAILLDKHYGYSYFRKAWAYQEMGLFNKALKYYEKCIEYDDKYVDAYLNISYIYSKQKKTKKSLIYANKALLINKEYAYAHYRKAWALQESGKWEEAIDGYSKAIELDPTDIYNYLGIACISLNVNESITALLYANKALFLDRNCGGAYYYKSLALGNLGKYKEAEKAYEKALKLGYSPG